LVPPHDRAAEWLPPVGQRARQVRVGGRARRRWPPGGRGEQRGQLCQSARPEGQLDATFLELADSQYRLEPPTSWADWFDLPTDPRSSPRMLVRPASDNADISMLQVALLWSFGRIMCVGRSFRIWYATTAPRAKGSTLTIAFASIEIRNISVAASAA